VSHTSLLTETEKHISRNITVAPQTHVKYKIIEDGSNRPIPARITIKPFSEGQAPVFFGLGDSVKAGSSIFTTGGDGEFSIPPGVYKITVTRGPEYESVEFPKITVFGDGRPSGFTAKMKRNIDTSGYISVAPGIMTRASYDGMLTAEDSLIMAAAEGVEVVITGDDGVATDLGNKPIMEKLSPWIKAITGKRIRLDNIGAKGDFLVFPVDAGLDHKVLTQKEYSCTDTLTLAATLRKHYPEATLQLCRPLASDTGAFVHPDYDPSAKVEDRKLPESTVLDFDLLEIFDAKDQTNWVSCYNLLQDLLIKGGRYGVSATSPARSAFNEESGFPRVYVISSVDDPARINLSEIASNMKSGKTFASYGPFVRFEAEGKTPGQQTKSKTPKKIECQLQVFRQPWMNLGQIILKKEGGLVWYNMPLPKDDIQFFPSPLADFSSFFPIRTMTKDGAITAQITGEAKKSAPMSPFTIEAPDLVAEYAVKPIAVTGPIYIDMDGNGKMDY